MRAKGGKKYYVHPTSIIDYGVKIGNKTKIWHFCHIMAGARIGHNCSLGQNVYVGGKAVIGNYVRIQNNVSVYDEVVLKDYVFCGPSTVFTNDVNPRSKYPKHGHYVSTLVKEGASIGANATIICGTIIGEHAFVGAGSVVTRNVLNYSIVYGNPARQHGWMCECGEKLQFDQKTMQCSKCHIKYRKSHDKIIKL
ncbi:MAG: DapH/DapD/GlmU-related protein [Patescibacteria group bacterium]|nr:DapH/DapD/GlmU-related protein [Patescibacteria group bacterium]MDD5715134.1 DapH/DapD/GlmU-related protein [Patescibacteria group bacterium]